MCSRDTGKGLRPIPDCCPHAHHHLPTTSEGLEQRRKDIRGQWEAGGDIWRDGGAAPRRDTRTGGEEPVLAVRASCVLQYGSGETEEPRGREERFQHCPCPTRFTW